MECFSSTIRGLSLINNIKKYDRTSFVVIAVGCVASVGAAYWLQLSRGLEPCTLCIIARYGLLLAALFAVVSIRLPVGLRTVGRAMVTSCLLVTAGAAARQLWVIANPSAACGRDALAEFLNGLPTATLWPKMFEANGLCGEVLEPIFGFSFPGLALMAALVLISIVWAPPMLRYRNKS